MVRKGNPPPIPPKPTPLRASTSRSSKTPRHSSGSTIPTTSRANRLLFPPSVSGFQTPTTQPDRQRKLPTSKVKPINSAGDIRQTPIQFEDDVEFDFEDPDYLRLQRRLFQDQPTTAGFIPGHYSTNPAHYDTLPSVEDYVSKTAYVEALREKGPTLLPHVAEDGRKRSIRERAIAINPSVDDIVSDDEEEYARLLEAMDLTIFEPEDEEAEEDEADEQDDMEPLPDTDIGTSFNEANKRPIRVHFAANNPPEPLPPDPFNSRPDDDEPRYPTSTPTQIATYTWCKIHKISKEAFQQFMHMRKQSWWRDNELPLSYTALHKLARFLPTETIYSHDVEVLIEEGDSSTKSQADCFFFKVEDIISRALRNPEIFDHCYFGLAKEENPIVETYNAVIGGVWPSSALAAKGSYPIQPPSWRDTEGRLLSRNLMVFPGSTVLAHMGTFLLPCRITGVFSSDRLWNKYSPENGEKFKSTSLNNIWVTVNPVLVTFEDLAFFGIEEPKSMDILKATFQPREAMIQKGILLLHEFVLPVDALVQPVEILLRRVSKDGSVVSDISHDMKTFLATVRKPITAPITYEVTDMVVPERESSINNLHLLNHFVAKQGLIYGSGGKKAVERTWKAPPAPPTMTTRGRTAGASPTPPPSPSKTTPGRKGKTTIVVARLVSIFHCPRTLTEGEIEKGEIHFRDLLFTDNPAVDTNGDKVITVCIDYYIDKFGVFRTTHRNVGGMYMTMHNLNVRGRDQPRNHFVLDFSPNGASTQESSIPMCEELRDLAKDGFRVQLQDGIWHRVYVKLLSVSADMAEANALAGCKAAGALEQLRLQHDIAIFRSKWGGTNKENAQYRDKGLVDQGVFEKFGPSFNQCIQVSLDIAHSEQKGIGEEMIATFISFLSDYGLREIARVTREFKLPPDASRIPNIGKRVRRLKMHEVTLILSMLPFMIERMQNEKSIWKESVLVRMNEQRTDEPWDGQTLKEFVIEVYDSIAKANRALFRREITTTDGEDPYLEIERLLLHSRRKIFELLEPIEKHAQAATESAKEWFANAEKLIDKDDQRCLLQREKPAGGGFVESEEEDNPDEDSLDDGAAEGEQRPRSGERRHTNTNNNSRRNQRTAGSANEDDDYENSDHDHDMDEDDTDEVDIDEDEDEIESDSRASQQPRRAGRGAVSRGKSRRTTKAKQRRGGRGVRGGRVGKSKRKAKKAGGLKPRNAKSSIATLPNFHTSTHAPSNSRRYGTSSNTATSVGEIQHQLWKALVLHSNLLELDLVFCKHANVLGALRSLIDRSQPKPGWPDKHPWEDNIRIVQADIPDLFTGYALGKIARLSADDGISRNKRGAASKLKFPDITLGSLLSASELKEYNFESTLRGRDMINDPLVKGLSLAYVVYGFGYGDVHMTSKVLKRGCKLFWWSSITLYDTVNESRYTYRPGSVISVDAELDDGICTHQHEKLDYIFLYVRWLYRVEGITKRGMPIYRVQNWSKGNSILPEPPSVAPTRVRASRNRTVAVRKTKWTNYIGLPAIRESKPLSPPSV
ncbi:hypothetical protein BJ508DRAFT_333369 [Ascobolus immersus RN42]|uniref:Uncharacterized protein n=1 Tax=Ascobolus immersus RN42 TaxID=1160509 RepID=A0A3N4HLK7_ASCIM|nr:hypothetical protein BJ508DRAFT_333369 [Ascobolus immersus RN42]